MNDGTRARRTASDQPDALHHEDSLATREPCYRSSDECRSERSDLSGSWLGRGPAGLGLLGLSQGWSSIGGTHRPRRALSPGGGDERVEDLVDVLRVWAVDAHAVI